MVESRLARRALVDETMSMVELARRRSLVSRVADPELKRLVGSVLEAAMQELLHLREAVDDGASEPPAVRRADFGDSADRERNLEEAVGT